VVSAVAVCMPVAMCMTSGVTVGPGCSD